MKKRFSLFCSGLLLLSLLIPAFSLPTFAVEKKITTDKSVYTVGEDILVTATGEGADWVGIYLKGETPGRIDSILWYYVAKDGCNSGDTKKIQEAKVNNSRSDLASIPAGEYTIYLLENDRTDVVLDQVDITVKPAESGKSVKTDKSEYTVGDDILITATGEGNDWVGVFRKGERLGEINAIRWYYVAAEGNTSGKAKSIFDPSVHAQRADLSDLPVGEYSVYLVANDGESMSDLLDSVDITVKDAQPVIPELYGYVQTRSGKNPETKDLRVLVEASQSLLKGCRKATLSVTFSDGKGEIAVYTCEVTEAYTSVIACRQTLSARDGYGFMGAVITGISSDVQTVSATVSLDGGEAIELGSAQLA